MDLSQYVDSYLEKEFPGASTSIYRDLSLNLKKVLEDGALEPKERFMNFLAVATSLHDKEMSGLAVTVLKELGATEEEIRESAEVAGLMGMNNVYYKFRSFLSPEIVTEHYNRAGLRMQSMMKPVTGKQNFEMMSLAVSCVNGCPVCVASHEQALRNLGVTPDKIHDLARLAAIAKGLNSLKAVSL